ncbi:MAG: hypothetical protein HETSPECPRED_005849 [Heterodermia speciosa]|uniref:Lytic polysaccharide monooxygenase n=1 Tax=Heterodermia speciosa TaxID=116794 RepID=A0A8H3FLC4_9LECA|nr:MAG: hypothetical protein HETSPECPRED_005849 [Heterodermia speciosa]
MFLPTTTLTTLLPLLLLPPTTAHVKIESPVPYGAGNAAPALDTNPLLASGADFPCKQRPQVYKLVHENILPLSLPQTLSFQGQATHGGGSCQISLSRDREPTRASVWKVIHSIEGGCPSRNPGNVGNDPFGFGADRFEYQVPAEVPEGRYTLAFTWFNKIGEREMYMNCAPVTVTAGGAGKRALGVDNGTFVKGDGEGIEERGEAFDALPDMFVANIGNGCSTAASGTDLKFPDKNLGKYVQRIDTGPLTPPIGNCGSASSSSSSSSSNPAGGAGGAQADPVPSPSPSPSPSAAKPNPSTLTTQPRPSPTHSTSTTTLTHPASTTTTTASAAAAQTPALPAGLTTGPCPTPGKSLCSTDGSAWGTCDENHVVIYQPVAQGTRCDAALGVEVHSRRSRVLRGGL